MSLPLGDRMDRSGIYIVASWLVISFDEKEIFATEVRSQEWATYTFTSPVVTGRHAMSVCLENDDRRNIRSPSRLSFLDLRNGHQNFSKSWKIRSIELCSKNEEKKAHG